MAYKLKTRSAAKKRFKKTASGRIKRSGAFHRHLLTKKSSKRKRHLRKTSMVADADHHRISLMLPY
jgi:large subunit ribosomal protein L35